MTDETYSKLRQLAIDLLNKGRTDGSVSHEPDMFRNQGLWEQLRHADEHIHYEMYLIYNKYKAEQDEEDHLAHAFTRILFAALLKQEAGQDD